MAGFRHEFRTPISHREDLRILDGQVLHALTIFTQKPTMTWHAPEVKTRPRPLGRGRCFLCRCAHAGAADRRNNGLGEARVIEESIPTPHTDLAIHGGLHAGARRGPGSSRA